jgi:hypothetical protein
MPGDSPTGESAALRNTIGSPSGKRPCQMGDELRSLGRRYLDAECVLLCDSV